LGLHGEVSFDAMSPAVIVDERLYGIFEQVGAELLGPDKVVELETPSMGSEDFGRYLDRVPGLLFRVGVGADCAGRPVVVHQTSTAAGDCRVESV